MNVREPSKIIRNLYKKYAKKEENIIFADKLFMINTIINYIFKDKGPTEVDKKELAYYGDLIDRYLKNEVDIFWDHDKLHFKELHYDGSIEGM